MPVITRRLEWDAGHRIVGHEGKCASLHGHRYRADISVETVSLDVLGRVVDFGVIKEVVGTWIEENWDHSMILMAHDPLLAVVQDHILGPKTPFIMADNPTAENMAKYLCLVAQRLFDLEKPDYKVKVVQVRL